MIEWIRRVVSVRPGEMCNFGLVSVAMIHRNGEKQKFWGATQKKRVWGLWPHTPEKNDTNCLFTAINFYQAVVFTADDQ
jgi:hypothetical protein